MKKKIRILHVFSGVGGGISTWIRKASVYSKNKYTVDAMAFSINNQSNFIDIIEKNGGKCYEMPRIRNGFIKLINYITSIIIDNNYDVVHCHIDGYASLPFWLSAKIICRRKFVVHSHRTSIEKYYNRNYYSWIVKVNKLCNRFISKYKIACGKKASNFAFDDCNVRIIHNGLDLITDNQNIHHKNKGRKIYLLALGRLNEVKNHVYLLKIAEELKKMGILYHLFIVGDGLLYNNLKKISYDNDLLNCVSFEGYSNSPESYFKKCDILLMPSLSEGLPTVMLEAQQYGCNVISSNLVTNECDLEIGLVKYLGINETNIKEWCNSIVDFSKKNKSISNNMVNERLLDKGFVNEYIYRDYYQYICEITGVNNYEIHR